MNYLAFFVFNTTHTGALENKEIMFHKEEEHVNQNVNFRTCFLLDMVD